MSLNTRFPHHSILHFSQADSPTPPNPRLFAFLAESVTPGSWKGLGVQCPTHRWSRNFPPCSPWKILITPHCFSSAKSAFWDTRNWRAPWASTNCFADTCGKSDRAESWPVVASFHATTTKLMMYFREWAFLLSCGAQGTTVLQKKRSIV